MMTLRQLRDRLDACLREGASPDSPITVEWEPGHETDILEDDGHFQADIESVTVEPRCEADEEPVGVYLNMGTRP